MSHYREYVSLMMKHPEIMAMPHRERFSEIGKRWRARDPNDITGAGLLDDLKNKIYSGFNAIKSRIVGVSKGIRLDFSPSIRDFIQRYGGWHIVGMAVMRQPVESYVKTLTNILSFGMFNKIMKERPDDIYHIFVRIVLQSPDGRETKDIITEKNQVIMLKPFEAKDRKNATAFKVNVPGTLTFKQFMDTGRNSTDPNTFFEYDPMTKNCGHWITIMMKANGLLSLNPGLDKFIFQDLKTLQEGLPSFSKRAMKGITDLAAVADVAIHGAGLKKRVRKRKQIRGSGLQDFIANNPQMPNGTDKEFQSFIIKNLKPSDRPKIIYQDVDPTKSQTKIDPAQYDIAVVKKFNKQAGDPSFVQIAVPRDISKILLSQGVPTTRKLEDIKYVLAPHKVFEYNVDGNNAILFGEAHHSASSQSTVEAYKPDTTNLYGYIEAIQNKGLSVKVIGENLRMIAELPQGAGVNTDKRNYYVEQLDPRVIEFYRLLREMYYYKVDNKAQMTAIENEISQLPGAPYGNTDDVIYTIVMRKIRDIIGFAPITQLQKDMLIQYARDVQKIAYMKYPTNFLNSFMDFFTLFSDVPTLIEMYKLFNAGIRNVIFINGGRHTDLLRSLFFKHYPEQYSYVGDSKAVKVDVSKIVLS
jgi:hypothetical protein